MQYKPVHGKIEPGMFDLKGEQLDIYSSTEKSVYRCFFDEDLLERIEVRDSITFELKKSTTQVILWPATQYLQDNSDTELILQQMTAEKDLRVKEFEKLWMLVEAERIKKRVEYDIRMIRETGFVNGIENYSLYFDKRLPGESPNTIFDYFPEDFLLIVDESHMTIPQLRAMSQGDRARKNNLIKYGFRLPSAIDHRPLRFEELEATLHRKDIKEIELDQATDDLELVSETHKIIIARNEAIQGNKGETNGNIQKNKKLDSSPSLHSGSEWHDAGWIATPSARNDKSSSLINKEARSQNQLSALLSKQKTSAKSIFLSATPGQYEIELSDEVVEQIIRPTGLLDPITYVYPKSGDYTQLLESVDTLLKKKPHLTEFLQDASPTEPEKDILKEVFGNESDL